MPPAARITDPTSHGSPLVPGPGSATVLIGGLPAWRAIVDQHACAVLPDGIGFVVKGSPTVFIDGQMACRMGDVVIEKPGAGLGPVNPIIMGCPTVIIGDVGAPNPQVVALISAALSGTPFCAECEKARVEQMQH